MATKTTKTAKTTDANKAGVLAVMRGINVTDAPMSSLLANGALRPVAVIRHGIRGTQNVAAKKSDKKADGAPGKEAKVSNPQITETAKTDATAEGLHVGFSLRLMPLHKLLTACDQPQVAQDIGAFLEAAKGSEELMELCRRYARRIFTGSFFWRNLHLAQTLGITATQGSQTVRVEGEQPFALAERGFADYTDAETTLAGWMRKAFLMADGAAPIDIDARLHFGTTGAFEVYPSQVYVGNKPTGFARPLYKLNPISASQLGRLERELERQKKEADPDSLYFNDTLLMGQAAIRDQKIGNALRTIDTWYASGDPRPIAVEPNGASLTDNTFYRDVASGNSFFDLRPRLPELTQALHPLGSNEPLSPEALFVLAVFIRGGVFGESSKTTRSDA